MSLSDLKAWFKGVRAFQPGLRNPVSAKSGRSKLKVPPTKKGWPASLLKRARNELPKPNRSRYIKVISASKGARNVTRRRNANVLAKAEATRAERIRATVAKVRALPVYLISAHACLCPREGKCFGNDLSKTFRLPKDTFVVTFAQGGEFSCVNETIVASNWDSIRDMLYLHSEAELANNPNVGKTQYSLFSGVRRAVGPYLSYPNINYTLNEHQHDKDGKKINKLVTRSKNPYGVYRLDTWMENYGTPYTMKDITVVNNSRSILPQDIRRPDMLLKDIIEEVYAKEGISSALFLSGGCLSMCPPETKNANTEDKIRGDERYYAMLLSDAHERYKGMLETVTSNEMGEMPNIDPVMNVGVYAQQAFPDPKNIKWQFEQGLIGKEGAMAMTHREDITEMEDYFKGVGV